MVHPTYKKQFSSSILLWLKTDKERQVGMDRWKGPHAKIITATPGFREYRQVHLTANNGGSMPAIEGIETIIPEDRRIDGIAEVTFDGILAPLKGRKQNKLAYADEVNLFRRTILYITLPGNARWYNIAAGEPASRAVIFIRRKDGVSQSQLKKFILDELAPRIMEMPDIRELRTEIYMKWDKILWNTPNVTHDNPPEVQYHAKISIGFESDHSKQIFFTYDSLQPFIKPLRDICSAVHALDVEAVYTMVRDGEVIL